MLWGWSPQGPAVFPGTLQKDLKVLPCKLPMDTLWFRIWILTAGWLENSHQIFHCTAFINKFSVRSFVLFFSTNGRRNGEKSTRHFQLLREESQCESYLSRKDTKTHQIIKQHISALCTAPAWRNLQSTFHCNHSKHLPLKQFNVVRK